MRRIATAVFAAAISPAGMCLADSTVESRVDSVGLFKNGVAVITRTIEVPGPGVYVLETVPLAVHGSFWLESDAIITTTTRSRNVEVPLDTASGSNLREELMGREVTARLREPGDAVYSGRVVMLEPRASDEPFSRRYEASPWGSWHPSAAGRGQPVRTGALMLDDGQTRHYITLDVIAAVTVHDPQQTMVRRQPVLELTVDAPAPAVAGPFTVTLTYLAKGITWAPAYLAQMNSGGELVLRQQATIRNELEDIVDAEIYLISGFPNIQFSHVDSLAGPTATIAGFFSQLNQRIGGARHATRRDVMSQAVVMSNFAAPDADLELDALTEGESSDIHYQFAGRRSLPAGAAVAFTIAEGETSYERIVEWIIEDDRDQHGRPMTAGHHQYNQQTAEEAGAWDAVRFRNPFAFPMTTAPMMVVDEGRFAGQRTSYWTNPNDRCSIPVTKALSVRTGHTESEQPETRRSATRFGRPGNLVAVGGTIELHNHRGKPVDMIVRRQFSGELVEAEESPAVRLRTEGIRSLNPRHELQWMLTLEPGEQRTIAYTYDVFILR